MVLPPAACRPYRNSLGDVSTSATAEHSTSHAIVAPSCPAAEFIVDLAIAHGKPFAVVPCCVYSSEFPRLVTEWREGGRPAAAKQRSLAAVTQAPPSSLFPFLAAPLSPTYVAGDGWVASR